MERLRIHTYAPSLGIPGTAQKPALFLPFPFHRRQTQVSHWLTVSYGAIHDSNIHNIKSDKSNANTEFEQFGGNVMARNSMTLFDAHVVSFPECQANCPLSVKLLRLFYQQPVKTNNAYRSDINIYRKEIFLIASCAYRSATKLGRNSSDPMGPLFSYRTFNHSDIECSGKKSGHHETGSMSSTELRQKSSLR